ncbi:hypothetical protein [uncultured Desulfobacter sp.]|uniref:hypothetical protein n=1 Tax=uncultured Desulfobacter sp. TaxID=240139 RepID=UPI00259BE625|nr:hypothetical protein [uncultured Desulfobacter sp.]
MSPELWFVPRIMVTNDACRGKKLLVIQQADAMISNIISDFMSQRTPGGVGGLLSDGESYPDSGAERLGQVLDEVSTAIHGGGAAVNIRLNERPLSCAGAYKNIRGIGALRKSEFKNLNTFIEDLLL